MPDRCFPARARRRSWRAARPERAADAVCAGASRWTHATARLQPLATRRGSAAAGADAEMLTCRRAPPTEEEQRAMAIDFTLSNEQRELQANAREFAENVLAPVVRAADEEPDPLRAFQRTKDAYVAAYKGGIAFCMLPSEYGGGGLSNVDLIIAAEEICAVDPGLRLHGARQRARPAARLVLRHRGAEGPLPAARDVRSRAASTSSATPRASRPDPRAAPRTSTRRCPRPSASA